MTDWEELRGRIARFIAGEGEFETSRGQGAALRAEGERKLAPTHRESSAQDGYSGRGPERPEAAGAGGFGKRNAWHREPAAQDGYSGRGPERPEAAGAGGADVTRLLELSGSGCSLRVDARGLALVSGDMELRGDFKRMLPRVRAGNLERELLVRAAKCKGVSEPVAVDATAGLGEDALLLAAAGFSVRLFERNPVTAALLRDVLRRAEAVPELAGAVGRMEVFERDSIEALPALGYAPDVVLLDPMFPERQKSAAVKKKGQLLQRLEEPCADEGDLLRAALAANPRKVVVKRPIKGPCLAGVAPSYTLKGKAVRYDCIVSPKRK